MSSTVIMGREETRVLVINGLIPGSRKGERFDSFVCSRRGNCLKFVDGEFVITFKDDEEAVLFKLTYSDLNLLEIVDLLKSDPTMVLDNLTLDAIKYFF